MKKLIITSLLLISQVALAVGPAPKELQGGVITVTLKDGKVYKFSSDEYAVVRRGTEEPKAEEKKQTDPTVVVIKKEDVATNNIVSVGIGKSQKGLTTSMSPSTVDVETVNKGALSLQYQRRLKGNKYLGGRVDTNGGAEVSIGVGF